MGWIACAGPRVRRAQNFFGARPVEIRDLGSDMERRLAAYVAETRTHDFVFVVDYPAERRAFYHMHHPNRPDLTKGFDLLGRGSKSRRPLSGSIATVSWFGRFVSEDTLWNRCKII
jgi:hypothetical protein